MNVFARILLVATSLAPALVVAGAGWWTADHGLAAVCMEVAALLSVLCVLLVLGIRRHGSGEVLNVDRAKRADKNVFPFLFTYVVPLLVPTKLTALQHGTNVLGLVAFAIIMFLVLNGTKIHDVNPVLSILGFHFFQVDAGKLGTVIVLTRASNISEKTVHAVRISDYLWLEKPRQSQPEATATEEGAPKEAAAMAPPAKPAAKPGRDRAKKLDREGAAWRRRDRRLIRSRSPDSDDQ